MMTTVGGTLTSRMEISVGIRIKEEMLVSEERMEHSEDPHQLCWTKLHPTTQCLQQVLNQVWQDVGHGWIDLQVTECYPAQVFTISCDSSHQQRKVLLVRLICGSLKSDSGRQVQLRAVHFNWDTLHQQPTSSEGRGRREVVRGDRGGEREVSQQHLLVLHRIEAILMNIHEWRRLHVVSIYRLDSTPFEGTVEILLANFLPICMVHELQCHFCDLANSEADVFYQDAGDFSRRLDAEVLCT
jgi:hypothetical protein